MSGARKYNSVTYHNFAKTAELRRKVLDESDYLYRTRPVRSRILSPTHIVLVFVIITLMGIYGVRLCQGGVAEQSKPPATQPWAPPVLIQYEHIDLFDFLPLYVRNAPPEFRRQWIKAHNEMTYLKAARRADEWERSHPRATIYIQDSAYQSNSCLDQNGSADYYGNSSVSANSTTGYTGHNSQRAIQSDRWGGGPVVIINPYTQD